MPSPASSPEKHLLVEGADDEHVICHLYQRAGHEVDFGVSAMGSVEQVIRSIRNEVRVPGRMSLGIVVDADDQCATRWQDISEQLISVGIRPPDQPTAGGFVEQPSGSGLPKVGVWLMPDNSSAGELEDFLGGLVPSADVVWPLAQTYVRDVFQRLPAQQRPKQAKAEIHAWLAGKNGGLPMGRSVSMGLFNQSDPAAQTFLIWLQDVFS